MEENKGSRIIALIALIIGIIGISLGFAAFTNTLTISSSATVTPDQSTFAVNLSKDYTGETTDGALVEDTNYTLSGGASITPGHTPTISNPSSGSSILSDIHVTFTAPGQSATFTVYSKNDGQYIAYLNSVKFLAATGASSQRETKICTKPNGSTATDSLVEAACAKINYSISVGSEAFETPATVGADGTVITPQNSHSLSLGGYEPIVLTIAYSSEGNVRVDGTFDVAFGDIMLNYSTAN